MTSWRVLRAQVGMYRGYSPCKTRYLADTAKLAASYPAEWADLQSGDNVYPIVGGCGEPPAEPTPFWY